MNAPIKKLITPPVLEKGMTVGILCTARKISLNELEPAIKIIEDWGLKIKIGKTIGASENQFAGDDSLRIQDFENMLEDQDIRAILCARGGYGTVRIIDQIDFSAFMSDPKWICGYSDITVLHARINQKYKTESLHCSMPINFEGNSQEALLSIQKALFGEKMAYTFGTHPLNQSGIAASEITGGNLSIIYNLSGTQDQLNTTNKILFIEDLDEYLYHIDRIMMNLKRSGTFHSLKGVIVGGMSDMNDNTIPFGKNAEEIIAEYFRESDIPVCFGFPAGHIEDNRAIILGRKTELIIDSANCKLSFKK